MPDIKKIKEEHLLKLSENLNLTQINEIKSNLFGKNGIITSQFKKLGSMDENKRKVFAADLNATKNDLQNLIEKKN
jgi:phenylalanyl-tRNA synthetase alpha chain